MAENRVKYKRFERNETFQSEWNMYALSKWNGPCNLDPE